MRFAANGGHTKHIFIKRVCVVDFYDVWSDVMKQKGLRKATSVFIEGKISCYLSPSGATLHKTVDKDDDNRHVENNTTLKRVETCAKLCNCYKDIGNRMQ